VPSLCAVTGNMQTLSGGGLPQGTVTFQLMNIAIGTIPQVTGTALLPKTQYQVQTALDGSFTVNLWGNDNIVPSTTFYGVTFRDVSGNELGPILFYILGASVNLNTLAASSGGALAIVNGVFTNPTINGTPTGTGIPTIVLKRGSGAGGTYSTSSVSLVDVDAAFLSYTVIIPVGWKLVVTASADVLNTTAGIGIVMALFDTQSSLVIGRQLTIPPIGNSCNIVVTTVVGGDGLSHTIKMQFGTLNAADAANIRNDNVGDTATMLFVLTPSN
jgi:hypothetical protein